MLCWEGHPGAPQGIQSRLSTPLSGGEGLGDGVFSRSRASLKAPVFPEASARAGHGHSIAGHHPDHAGGLITHVRCFQPEGQVSEGALAARILGLCPCICAMAVVTKDHTPQLIAAHSHPSEAQRQPDGVKTQVLPGLVLPDAPGEPVTASPGFRRHHVPGSEPFPPPDLLPLPVRTLSRHWAHLTLEDHLPLQSP